MAGSVVVASARGVRAGDSGVAFLGVLWVRGSGISEYLPRRVAVVVAGASLVPASVAGLAAGDGL